MPYKKYCKTYDAKSLQKCFKNVFSKCSLCLARPIKNTVHVLLAQKQSSLYRCMHSLSGLLSVCVCNSSLSFTVHVNNQCVCYCTFNLSLINKRWSWVRKHHGHPRRECRCPHVRNVWIIPRSIYLHFVAGGSPQTIIRELLWWSSLPPRVLVSSSYLNRSVT